MSLIAELKRRNVFRVGLAYVIASWLIIQVLEIVLESFGTPDWVMKTVLVVLACGLPLALIFAWAFEVTPEGIKREKDVDRAQSITQQTGRKLDYIIIAILALALGYFIWESRFSTGRESPSSVAGESAAQDSSSVIPAQTGTPNTPATAQPSDKSVAVLPFVNMSSDPEQEYFSDGISEEILNALARVKDLKVAGRTSSFAFKGQNQDLRKIGQTLGVQNILEGSVRKSGNTVRITAQLIQVEDGFHLWSDTYDRELNDVFAIQDEISAAILEQLKAHLLAEEQLAVVTPRANSEAYDQYLLAKQRIYERSRPALESAAKLLDRAIAIDDSYAPAYAQRAITSLLLSDRNYGTLSKDEADTQAKLYIDQALRLDPDQPEALAALGLYHMNRPGENDQAIEALERALEINPNLVNAANWLQSSYADADRLPEALSILESLRERDPLYRPGIANLNAFYVFQNRLEEAQAQIEEVRPFMPNDPFLLRLEAGVLYATGNFAQGLAIAERALSIQPDNYPNINLVGRGLEATGQFERLAGEGIEQQRAFALVQLGRMEEATLLAEKLAATGEDPSWLIGLLANYGQEDEMVRWFDQRWPDLAAYEAEYPSVGPGDAGTLLDIAYAYGSVGNGDRFDEALQRARQTLDKLRKLGFQSTYIDFVDAVYYTMAGDHEKAIALLTTAVDNGWVSGVNFSNGWAGLQVLEGTPEYEAVQARMIEHLNNERAELGLEPILI